MYQLKHTKIDSKQDLYDLLHQEAKYLFELEHNFIANASNLSSLIFHMIPDLNWAGIYIKRGTDLVLGPFQGKPACVRIPIGKGVCGQAAINLDTLIIDDVHQFTGHIACDAASTSEIVVPLINMNKLLGVLDLDSPLKSRFDLQDQRGLEKLVRIFLDASDNL